MMMRIGHGYDVHKLIEGRELVLGGVVIPYTRGLDGHSDADVLVHAVMDALLGAMALGDIGVHFPDTDDKYAGISSLRLLSEVAGLMQSRNVAVGNLDATIVAQKPKLIGYIPEMRKKLAETLECSVSQINIKATTEEGMGFTGNEQGIAAHAVCLLAGR